MISVALRGAGEGRIGQGVGEGKKEEGGKRLEDVRSEEDVEGGSDEMEMENDNII